MVVVIVLFYLYLAIGLGLLGFMLADREVRKDVLSWDADAITTYVLSVVLAWPVVVVGDDDDA